MKRVATQGVSVRGEETTAYVINGGREVNSSQHSIKFK
jgi:hypothetical protein